MAVPLFARTHLFDPLGIGDVDWAKTAEGTAMTGGGLLMTTQDLCRLGLLVVDGGQCAGDHIIASNWLIRSTTAHVQVGDATEYGYLWWLKDVSVGQTTYPCRYMAGAGGNRVAVFPTLDLVVVVTSENFGRSDAHDLTEELITEHVVAVLAAS